MSSGGSLSFDRAAEYYDATRGRSDEIERSVARLAEILGGRDRCLEVGVGTGRVALPLHQKGIDLVGIDISARMMAKMREKTSGRHPFPLVQGDATRIPFRAHSFDAAYSIWVLHLIPAWERVLDELLRVLRPGSPIVVTLGGKFGSGPWEEIASHFREITGAAPPGAGAMTEIDAAMDARGYRGTSLEPLMTTVEVSAEDILHRLEANQHSFTWVLDDATLSRG
ncbi:MAG TPA: class I SAM-dependent methyltransferase, partial [Actinomycetota bacterium]|nr:class I SAM-dependent methyltransferase [Actinomycetota bacterium]